MLTDAKIRSLPLPKKGRKKYADGGGLSLLVSPAGSKVWYLRKRVDGKEQMISLGAYPAVSLADARRAAEEVGARLAMGLPPKEEPKPVTTFGELVKEWLVLQASRQSPAYVPDLGAQIHRADAAFQPVGVHAQLFKERHIPGPRHGLPSFGVGNARLPDLKNFSQRGLRAGMGYGLNPLYRFFIDMIHFILPANRIRMIALVSENIIFLG